MLILPPKQECSVLHFCSFSPPFNSHSGGKSSLVSISKTPFRLLHLLRQLSVSRCSINRLARPPRISVRPSCLNLSASHSADDDFDVELGRLLALLPEEMRRRVSEHPELHHLIELVMDLGREPLARFPSGDFVLSEHPITADDIELATAQVGNFAVDNRAGISRTLHRISAIRNRKGTIIGLTCRVGRAVSESANLLRDLVEDGGSLLVIGPPGVGKTTIIRDIARMLADDYQKRVMIVDTSNEIGGDGDIPHAGIGSARRLQVPHSDMQHKVLIEAVENHMPQVIVIDEIGTKLEAIAASTIAQRGIQLVATAHGVTIENLVMNPSLEVLVGGIQSVTLGDEEASRRGVQKTVLERKGPSTFSSGVELISKTVMQVHHSLEATVDSILSGRNPNFEVRKINQGLRDDDDNSILPGEFSIQDSFNIEHKNAIEVILHAKNEIPSQQELLSEIPTSVKDSSCKDGTPLRMFLYGIPETSVMQGFKQLKIDDALEFTDNISEADVLLALQSKLKKNSRIQAAARSCGIPIYITKLTKAIQALMTDYVDDFEEFKSPAKINLSEKFDALEEVRVAIEQVVIPEGEPVELLPRSSNIILLQKDLILKYKLQYERVGSEPQLRLRILPFQNTESEGADDSKPVDAGGELDESSFYLNAERDGSSYTLDRLPLLPD